MVFMHSLRYQWHNDDPIYDGVPMLQNLRLSHVASQGYVNLRCAWLLGCPAEIHPKREQPKTGRQDDRTRSEVAYAEGFTALFPGTPVPDEVGVGCGAQFAVSREKVLERPRESYEAYRKWLLDTPLEDAVSGRVMEYSWHSESLQFPHRPFRYSDCVVGHISHLWQAGCFMSGSEMVLLPDLWFV